MARQTEEREIGGVRYKVTQLGAKTGESFLYVRLPRLLGPGLGEFITGLGRASDVESAIANGLGDAIRDLAQRVNDQDYAAIRDEFAKLTVVALDAEREMPLSKIYDDHFAGRYQDVAAWLGFCLEVNYRGFFDALLGSGKSGRLAALWAKWSASQSPSTSTGSSTGSPAAQGTAAA